MNRTFRNAALPLLFPLLLFLLLSLGARSQSWESVTIAGTVRDASTSRPVGSVNVMLQDTARRLMYGYAITGDDGAYRLEYRGEADSLVVAVTGFNIRPQARRVAARTQRVDLAVETGELKIREVRVEAPAVVRRSDTLTYTVAKYADVADHSIGDVLRKMPGIEVAKSGEIKYNGKSINKFYIEGLDMLEGRYGIATNNVRARDIASVQVFENHQPIKALKELVASDRAALNLKLKEEAKGTWNATLQLGAGYKPWMWNGEATAMYFGRDFQTIDTYKTNNTGDDVSRELTSFYGGLDEASTLLGVHRPTEPSLERERYLDNEIHTVATNAIVKLRKELELTANAHYVHDFQTSEGGSVTTYYLPDAAPLVVTEQSLADHCTDRTEVNLQLRSNTERHYLQERLTFGGQWDADYGRVLNDGERVDQRFRLPKISLRNLFTDVRRWGRWAVNFRSETDYTTQPTSLRIRPMLYPEVFDAPADYPDALQTLDSRRFRTRNSAFTAYSVRRWNFSLNAALNAQVERMESSLSAMNATGGILPAADTLRNDIYWRRLDLVVGPSVGYRIGDRFSASLYVPLDFMSLRTEDRNLGRTTTDNRLLVTPSLTLQSNLTYNLKFSARAAYNEQIGGLYDTYSGYILTDYRMIASKEGDISRTRMQNYTASLSYGNAIRALFGSLDVGYRHARHNLTYGTTYYGSLSRIEAQLRDNTSEGYNIDGRLSKRFDAISTTVNLSGSFSRTWSEVLRQDVAMQTTFDRVTAGFGFSTRFSKAVRLDYEASYSRSQSRIEGGERIEPIDVLRQDAAVNFTIRKRWICRVGGEHYYNAAVGGADRTMFFLDAGLSYRTRRMEYSVEARNLLDTGLFRSATQSDITDYVYSYCLRPAAVLFKVKFSLR
mgnify:FL=1